MKKKITEIKNKFKEFQFCKISDTALTTYDKYYKDKLKALHVKK